MMACMHGGPGAAYRRVAFPWCWEMISGLA